MNLPLKLRKEIAIGNSSLFLDISNTHFLTTACIPSSAFLEVNAS